MRHGLINAQLNVSVYNYVQCLYYLNVEISIAC